MEWIWRLRLNLFQNIRFNRKRIRMKLVIQRVLNAHVSIEQQVVGEIKHGFVVLLGITQDDTLEIATKMADKLCALRVFADADGKTNLSIRDVGGSFLIISQFTLCADCRKGNRPSFIQAMKPDQANDLYEFFMNYIRDKEYLVESGEFGADMQVSLVNDGPFTIILDSDTSIR